MPPALVKHVLVPLLWDPLDGLIEAALVGSIKFVQLFLDLEAPINGSPWILINAVKSGSIECLNYLLSKGALRMSMPKKSHEVRSLPWTDKRLELADAVDFAVYLGQFEMFKLLESKFECEIAYCTHYYLTVAAICRHTDMVKYFYPKVTSWYTKMETFAIAILDRNYDLVDFLAQAGAQVLNWIYYGSYKIIAKDPRLFLGVKDTLDFQHDELFKHIDPNDLNMLELIFKDLKLTKKYTVHMALAAMDYVDRHSILETLIKLDFQRETIGEVLSVPYPYFLVSYPDW